MFNHTIDLNLTNQSYSDPSSLRKLDLRPDSREVIEKTTTIQQNTFQNIAVNHPSTFSNVFNNSTSSAFLAPPLALSNDLVHYHVSDASNAGAVSQQVNIYEQNIYYNQILNYFNQNLQTIRNTLDCLTFQAINPLIKEQEFYRILGTLNQMLEIDRDNIETLILRADTYFGLHALGLHAIDHILEDLNRILEIDPYNIEALRRRAPIHFVKKQREQGWEDLNRLLQSNKDDWFALYLQQMQTYYESINPVNT